MEANRRKEIITALELCKSPKVSDCNACPYKGKSVKDGVYVGCTNTLMTDAFALIKAQAEDYRKLKEVTLSYENFIEELTQNDKLIADTVRKMQTEIEARCVKGGIYPAFVKRTIEQIAEEIIEGKTE